MSDPNHREDAERLYLMKKLADKGIGELVEEICDLKSRLAMEAKHRHGCQMAIARF